MRTPRLRTMAPRLATLDTSIVKAEPKRSDPHYSSAEHLAWRAAVIRRAGFQCEKCTARGKLYADHIVELRDGGAALDPRNGRALCASCHTKKTNLERVKRYDLTGSIVR